MTLTELDDKYYFHDSSLDAIRFDQNNNSLEMDIDFCFWMQTDYVKTSPGTGMIQLVFKGVRSFSGESGYYKDATILKLKLINHNQLSFYVIDEDKDKFIELTIIAETVDFVVK